MRVTANTFSNSLVDQLSKLAIRQGRLQHQAASGQRITDPDDDPVAMRRVLDMQTEARSNTQHLRNIQRNQEVATASFASIKALSKVMDRAGEIATLADGLKSQDELNSYAAEINEFIQESVGFANAKNRGDYLFGGTRADQPPFVMTRNADGLVTDVTYQGNTDLAENEISTGLTIAPQSLGANTSGAGPRGLITDSRSGADVFKHLIALRDNLLAGDTDAIANVSRKQLAADEDNLIYHIGTNGAVQSRLETASAMVKQRSQSIEGLVSKEVDADLAETMVRLGEVQTAYQAALQSGGSILKQSLLDYIR